LLYYWHHRAGHRVALFWAAHVVHHQSEDYNLSTALRQTSSGWLAGWLFYLPMALAGFPPLVFGVVALIDLLYQFWVHTEQVGRLGWFDRWFCAPSNHRVHHAVNEAYLDRNYGGVFIVWDRLFGTYAEEDQRASCVYGTRAPLRGIRSGRTCRSTPTSPATRGARGMGDKLRVWCKPRAGAPTTSPRAGRSRRSRSGVRAQDGVPRARLALAFALFAALLARDAVSLVRACAGWPQRIVWDLIISGLWAVGRLGGGAPRVARAVPTAATPARSSTP
jgi:hypothetical protein